MMIRKTTMEKWSNRLFGLTFFGWAFANLFVTEDAASIVRICIAALHVTAGTLILFRSPVKNHGTIQSMIGCIPGIVSAGLVFRLAGSTDQWPSVWIILFGLATVWSILSLLTLGDSFAVFPSLRSIKQRGPYAVVRHPAYLGEIGMIVCCAAVAHTYLAWPALALAIATIVIRILIEEKLLVTMDGYRDYQSSVPYRLIPRLW
ncbi:MAG: isoprenylcysteine carboxylmethyltransferase family protein [Planctomycetota bacterium]